MPLWIFIAVAVLLVGVAVRMWHQFGQRQLPAQVQRPRGLLDSHTEGNEAIRARTTDLEQATKAFISRREELHGRVLQDRERLTEMEERLERIRPPSRRQQPQGPDQGRLVVTELSVFAVAA